MHIAAPYTLQYRQPLNQDLRLLHVDEETLQQVLAGRCAQHILKRASMRMYGVYAGLLSKEHRMARLFCARAPPRLLSRPSRQQTAFFCYLITRVSLKTRRLVADCHCCITILMTSPHTVAYTTVTARGQQRHHPAHGRWGWLAHPNQPGRRLVVVISTHLRCPQRRTTTPTRQ